MSSFRIPILLSLLLHILFIGLFAFLLKNKRTSSHLPDNLTVFITTSESEHVMSEKQEDGLQERAETITPSPTTQVMETKPDRPDVTSSLKTNDPEEKAWMSFLKEGEARVSLMRQDEDKDATRKEQKDFTKPTMGPLRIEKPGFGGRDPVADGIYKRNVGAQPFLLNLTPVADNEENKPRPHPSLDFLPTKTQLRCLSCLLDADSLSDTQLYPLLGSVENGTFETYQKNVEELIQKGLLTRKRISPRQIFSLFGIPIEMNAKNRRNPEFLYKPNIDRKTLLIFLEARLYGIKEQLKENPGDSIRIQNQINSLVEKLTLVRPVSD